MNNLLGYKGVPLPQMKNALGPLEILPERLVDDLRDGQAVQVRLTPDRLDPSALNMEGDALGVLSRVDSLGECSSALLPPGHDLLQVGHHADEHIIIHSWYTFGGHIGRRGRLDTFLPGCGHGRCSRARVSTRCTPTSTEV